MTPKNLEIILRCPDENEMINRKYLSSDQFSSSKLSFCSQLLL